MALSSNNPNCLGGQMSMANEPGGHPGAQMGQGVGQGQEMMQSPHPQQQPQAVALQQQYGHHGHHMGHGPDQYGGYMAPSSGVQPPEAPMGPNHQYHGQHQWYVHPQPPHHAGGMMAPAANAQQQDYRHLPHQQYHHQQPYHLDMNGGPAGAGGWNTVQNNVGTAVPISVASPVAEPVEASKDCKDSTLNPAEEGKKLIKRKNGGRRKTKTLKVGKVKAKKEDGKVKAKRRPRALSKKVKDEPKEPPVKAKTTAIGDDENVNEVSEHFSKGCECVDQNCYEGMDPEAVYKHRLNIDELTKLEHDMYLMGMTMACLEGTDETHRHKERKRLRSKYRFKGKEVCLGAFLFLEHTTLHQLKSIRKHIRDHGVTPRIHGNHRKRPHNTFTLDIYQRATKFLQAYFDKNSFKDINFAKKKGLIMLPTTTTCKKIHAEYKIYCTLEDPDGKLMAYSTFRHFIKEQFPNLRFQQDEMAKPIPDA